MLRLTPKSKCLIKPIQSGFKKLKCFQSFKKTSLLLLLYFRAIRRWSYYIVNVIQEIKVVVILITLCACSEKEETLRLFKNSLSDQKSSLFTVEKNNSRFIVFY